MRPNICGKCYVPLTDVNWYPSSQKRRLLRCSSCELARQRQYMADNPRQARKNALKNKYGLTLDEYDNMLQKQEGVCAICKSKCIRNNLCVDHDHKTNKVRGLLCIKCNAAIGHFDDRVDLLDNAKVYLNESRID